MKAHVLDCLVFAGCGVAAFLGQANLTDAPIDFKNVTALGVLAFYMWWNTTRTIPSLIKDFREDVADKRREYIAAIREHSERFEVVIRNQEQAHFDQLELVTKAVRGDATT